MKKTVILFLNLVFLLIPMFAEKQINILHIYSFGSLNDEIGFDAKVMAMGDTRYSPNLIKIHNGFLYVFDPINQRINVMDLEGNFIREISDRYSMAISGAKKCIFNDQDMMLILEYTKGLSLYSSEFKLRFNIERSRLPRLMFSTGSFFFYKNFIVLFDDVKNPIFYDYNGNEISQSKTGITFDEITFKFIIKDLKYYKPIIQRNNTGFSDTDIVNKYFIGQDHIGNSYWRDIGDNNETYIMIFSKDFYLVDRIDDSNIKKAFYFSKITVHPNGDLFLLTTDKENEQFLLQRIPNTWDPEAKRLWEAAQQNLNTLTTLKATTTLTEPNDHNAYHPAKLFDHDPKTMWIEAAAGPGIGESVSLSFNKDITIDAISFQPGCFWESYWKQNHRVKMLTITVNGKNYLASFTDEMKDQQYKFPEPVTFRDIKFTIKDTWPSSNWDDTAISEIRFFSKGKEVEVDLGEFAAGLEKR